MTRRLRVLWLTKGLGRGGSEILLVSLARAMRSEQVQLEVGYVLPHKDALVPALEAAGVTVHCLGEGTRLDWVPALWRRLRANRYDVVHSHSPVLGAAARCLAPADAVMAHTEHNVWQRYRAPTRWANALTLNRNAVVWAVSEGVARSIRPPRLAGRRPPVQVMLHGVDPADARRGPDARARARALLGLPTDVVTIGTVGNLTDKKDHVTLLHAFAFVQRKRQDARLVIVGTGPREARLRNLADELGVARNVHFLGLRDDVAVLLPAMDLFALSSLHEGLSIALIEALAAGLPVVATRVGGIPEVIRDGVDGLLVPPSQPAVFAGAVSRLLDDPDLRQRFVDNAPDRAAAFGINNAAETLSAAYVQLAMARSASEARA